jgi:outer membrane protein OmpA-like peptidoglycan-associated protein
MAGQTSFIHRIPPPLKVILIIIWVIVFIMVLANVIVPPIVASQLRKQLKENGLEYVRIEDVAFNSFTLTLTIHTLIAEQPSTGRLQWQRSFINIAFWPLWAKRIKIQDITLNNAIITVLKKPDGTMIIGGIKIKPAKPVPAKKRAPQWQIGIVNANLNNVLINYTSPLDTHQIIIRGFHVDSFLSWKTSIPTKFDLNVKVDTGTIYAAGQLKPLGANRSGIGVLQIKSFPLSWARPYLKAAGITSLGGTLDLNLKYQGNMTSPQNYRAVALGSAVVNNINASTKMYSLYSAKTEFSGTTMLQPDSIKVNGGLTIQPTVIRDIPSDILILDLSGLKLNDLKVSGLKNISIGNVILSDIRALKKGPQTQGPYVVNVKNINANNIRFVNSSRFLAHSININTLNADLIRLPNGHIQAMDYITEILPPPPAKPGPKKPPMAFLIDSVKVNDSSLVHFVDQSVKPVVNLTIHNFVFNASDLSSVQYAKVSGFDVSGSFFQFSNFKFDGTTTLYDPKKNTNVSGKINSFVLPTLGGYLQTLYGYRIYSGRLNYQTTTKVTNNKLNSSNKIDIYSLNLEPIPNAPAYGKFKNQFLIRLPTALSLLQNAKGDVNMDLPVSGDLGNPKIPIGEVITTALTTSVSKALQKTFSSLGGIISTNNAQQQILNFKEIDFAPGQERVSSSQKGYLDKFASTLAKYKGIRILLCGKATDADKHFAVGMTDEKLRTLARTRSVNVKDYLISKGINAARLFICDPQIDNTKGAKPRVEISI